MDTACACMAPRCGRMSSVVLGLLTLLGLVLLSACGSSGASVTPTVTPFLQSGQSAIFASFVTVSSKNGTPGSAPQGKLLALRVGDTKPAWSIPLDGVATSVLSSNGTLYLAGVSASNATSSAQAGTVEARRMSDGTRIWHSTADATASLIAADSTAIYASTAGPQSPQGEVVALRASDGQRIWSTSSVGLPVGAGALGGGALADGTLYFAGNAFSSSGPGGTVTALRASDGKTLWSAPISGEVNPPVLSGGTVYVSALAVNGNKQPSGLSVTALRATDGTPLWSKSLAAGSQAEAFSPVVASATAVFVAYAVQTVGSTSPTTAVLALDPATGSQLWSEPGAGVPSSLFSDGSALYVSSISAGGAPSGGAVGGALTAYQASDGKQIWSQQGAYSRIVGPLNASIVALGVIEGSDPSQVTGTIETLSPQDGSAQWTYSASGEGPVAAAIGTVA